MLKETEVYEENQKNVLQWNRMRKSKLAKYRLDLATRLLTTLPREGGTQIQV